MARKHSWNWLPTRVTRIRPANPSLSGAVRPPLAVLEQLEDRVLLSTSDGGGGAEAVLIGLLKGQIDLRQAELSFLSLAGDLSGQKSPLSSGIIIKFGDDLLKMDSAFAKLAEWSLAEHKDRQDFMTLKYRDIITDSLAKIETDVKLLGEGDASALLLPAVQKVREAATRALGSVSQIGDFKLDGKLEAKFLQIENILVKIDLITDKWTTDFLLDKLNKGADDRVDIKLTEAFDKLDEALAGFADGSVFKALQQDILKLETSTLNFVDTFGSPITIEVTDDQIV